MPATGRIPRGSLSSINESGASETAVITIVINGRVINNIIPKLSTVLSNTQTFEPPIEVAQNDRINFQTNLDTSNATNNIVSLLIELDLYVSATLLNQKSASMNFIFLLLKYKFIKNYLFFILRLLADFDFEVIVEQLFIEEENRSRINF